MLAGVLDTDMTTTIIDWRDEEMNTLDELTASLEDGELEANDSDLRFQTPDGKHFKISCWPYSQFRNAKAQTGHRDCVSGRQWHARHEE